MSSSELVEAPSLSGTSTFVALDDVERPAEGSACRWRFSLPRVGEVGGRRLAYLLPVLLAVIVTQLWFVPGTFVATGDVAPFVRDDLILEDAALWGHSLTGAGSPSFQPVARAPETVLIGLGGSVGLSPEGAQRVFYTLLTAALVAAVVSFAFVFVERPLAAGFAGSLALLNPYILQHVPNPLPLWAIALMAASASVILRVAVGAAVPPVVLALLAVPAGYLALNPPLLVVTVVWIVAVTLVADLVVGEGGRRRASRYLLRALPWAIALSLWWTLPWLFTLGSAGTGYRFAAETDVQAWAWTHARTSIANVLALRGSWNWGFPEYFPFASQMDRGVWGLLPFALPAMAFLAPFVARPERRRLARWIVVGIIAVVFVAKGLHPPLSGVNAFFYAHVPGMWLLREPLAKLGPVIVLAYAALIAMTIEGVLDLRRSPETRRIRSLGRTTAVLVSAAVLYPFPLWTGAAIPDERPLLPPAHVRIPEEWRQVAALLNAAPEDGKVMVLPLADYYQMPTTWGYYGVDVIPSALLARPTIQPKPESYYGELPGYEALVTGVQRALIGGDPDAVAPLLRALGVSYVVVRHDIDTDYPRPTLPDPVPVEAGIEQVSELSHVASFAVADVYRLGGSGAPRVAASTRPIVLGTTKPADIAVAVASADAPGSAITPFALPGAPDSEMSVIDAGTPSIGFDAGESRVRLSARSSGSQVFHVGTSDAGELVLTPATTVELDGGRIDVLPSRTVPFGGPDLVAVGVDDQIVPIHRGSGTLALPASARVTAYQVGEAQALRAPSSWRVRDCNAYDHRSIARVGIAAEPLDEAPLAVRLRADDHSACVSAPVEDLAPGAGYLVDFQYRRVRGAPPRVCLWQIGPDRCAVLPPMPDRAGWSEYAAAMIPEEGTTGLRLYLYADAVEGPSVAEYRGVGMSRLVPVRTATVRTGPLDPQAVRISEGSHNLELLAPGGVRLAPIQPVVSDCHAYDERSIAQAGLSAQLLPGEPQLAVRLRADGHAACVSTAVTGFTAGASYRVRLQYRSVSGAPARMCLWQEGVDRCAELPRLPDREGWQRYDAVTHVEPGTVGLRLYLYADGPGGGGTTVADYRAVDVSLHTPLAVAMLRSDGAVPDPPAVWVETESASTFLVHVDASTAPFLLSLRESVAEGWTVSSLPGDRLVRTVEVDGYAQGWWIRPGSAMTVRIAFGPDMWARRALVFSLTAFALASLVLHRAWRRRRASEAVA